MYNTTFHSPLPKKLTLFGDPDGLIKLIISTFKHEHFCSCLFFYLTVDKTN
nr:MAG TPA: hypothetical protein [Caudoviricetes sp.]